MILKVYTGTSGWSYKGWKEKFYPEKMNSKNFLSYYITQFNSTEINSSFYRLPTQETIIKWGEVAPKDFMFCPKMSRYLSHMKKLNEPEEPLIRFFDLFDHMHEKTGPVLVQLPSMVKYDHEKVNRFYSLLSTKYRQYRFALEARHESWFEKKSIEAMKHHAITNVVSYSGNHFPLSEEVTAKDIYIRFHGPTTLYSSNYSKGMLEDYARKWKPYIAKGHRVWSFFNNDVNAYAPKNAKTFHKFMTDKNVVE